MGPAVASATSERWSRPLGVEDLSERPESLATLGSFTAQEQLLTRQSLAVNANLQAVAQAYWIDREAQARATFRVLAAETALAAYQSTSPGWTFVPPGTPLPW